MKRRLTLFIAFLFVIALVVSVAPIYGEPIPDPIPSDETHTADTCNYSFPLASADWDLPTGGHFFTQAGGGANKGYAVTNESGVNFWNEFNRLGGVQAIGYPVSQRFQLNGYTCQAFQKVVMQWQAASGTAAFVNVFDLLHDGGIDDWLLSVRQTPKPLQDDFTAGLDWNATVAKRLALLDSNSAIKAQYNAVIGDPVHMNGLPTSAITDMGDSYAIRCQRIVIQQWKKDVPWASAGQVTVANGGDITKEAGTLPAASLQPSDGNPPVTTVSTPTPTSIPNSTPIQSCCRVCTTGKACGNSCINVNLTCHQPPGCACNAR
jgi:hypothetical protein